jgi:hypothetical protein
MMAPVLSVATGLLIFVILIIFAPTIAGAVENAQPDFGVCTQPALGGTDVWTTVTGTCGTANATTTMVFVNATAGGGGDWNPASNDSLPTGVETWTTNVQILGVVVLIISIAIAMYYLKGMA